MSYILEEYDNALENILRKGVKKSNRTGVDTISLFGMQTRYRIDEKFPILTRRKVWPKAIFAELLWFISGSTNNKDLQALGSNIWTPWVDKDFENKHGYIEGSLGPVYGFQLRHFGGEYGNGSNHEFCNEVEPTWKQYGHGGFDQLEYIIKEIKENPESRRILWSLWNPNDLNKMRLPPCHVMFQLYVSDNKLSGMLTQRSADYVIGACANTQFYSALIYMLAQQTGYQPYEFIHSTGDSHIYTNQIEAVEEYLSRDKPESPSLELKQEKSMYDYTTTSFLLKDYKPLKAIKIPVTV